MSNIYICGHQNPDTDSIVAAISYAELKRLLGEHGAKAVRLGTITPETSYVLERFGIEPPMLMKSARTQVRDIAFDMPPTVSASLPLRKVWETMSANRTKTMPVVSDEGKLLGVCTSGDISDYDLKVVFSEDGIQTSTQNLNTTLAGRLICGSEGVVTGGIHIALNDADFHRHTGILLAEWREGIEKLAANARASCVILCHAHSAEAEQGITRVIATPHDLFRAARLAAQSPPVSEIMRAENLITFTLDDYLDDVRAKLLSSRYRSYPILNNEGRVAGAISRIHLINNSKKRMVLVDHNERSQAVSGLEQADIVEIIDHHRLGDLQTGKPMYFRNEPVGSTTTIIASMYQESGQKPSPEMAGLMLAGIVSDTVIFRSPTCTEKDRHNAQWLASIAELDVYELGQELFHALDAQLDELTAEQLFFHDFKEYSLGGKKVGVSQITCWSAHKLQTPAMREFMENLFIHERFDILLFIQTEIEREGSLVLHFSQDDEVLTRAFGVADTSDDFFLTGVMSRKKQVIPALSRVLM